jgi:hypothetical protein
MLYVTEGGLWDGAPGMGGGIYKIAVCQHCGARCHNFRSGVHHESGSENWQLDDTTVLDERDLHSPD